MQANQWPLIVFSFLSFFALFQRGFGRYLAGVRPLPSNRLEATDKCCGQKHILSGAGRFELCWTTTTSCCLCHIQNVVRLRVATGWRLTNFKKCPCEVTLIGVVSDRAVPDLIFDFGPVLLEYNFLLGLYEPETSAAGRSTFWADPASMSFAEPLLLAAAYATYKMWCAGK